MKTLIIYDTKGTIISTRAGEPAPTEPVGVPYLWVDVPNGKQITNIDVSVIPNVAVLGDLPKSEVDTLKEQVDSLNIAIANIMGA